MNVSVVIPTYNRATTLTQAIRSAAAVNYPSDGYEIIVVDNASTDATRQVVKNLQSNVDGRVLRYVSEDRLGLHNARHADARAANGEILVFTDDDATFDPGWLQGYATAFPKHLDMAAAGGPDSAFSLEPQELKQMVDAIRIVEKALGCVSYELTKSETASRVFRRSLFVV